MLSFTLATFTFGGRFINHIGGGGAGGPISFHKYVVDVWRRLYLLVDRLTIYWLAANFDLSPSVNLPEKASLASLVPPSPPSRPLESVIGFYEFSMALKNGSLEGAELTVNVTIYTLYS